MTQLSFRDIQGQTGVVKEDLEVEYSEEWESEVNECVDRVEDELYPGDSNIETEDAFTELIIELPKEAPIVAVERETARKVTLDL